jgi:hypothetical protein
MDSSDFYNTVLEGVKADALAGTRKATLRDFHLHVDNWKVDNSKLTKGKLDEIRLRWVLLSWLQPNLKDGSQRCHSTPFRTQCNLHSLSLQMGVDSSSSSSSSRSSPFASSLLRPNPLFAVHKKRYGFTRQSLVMMLSEFLPLLSVR